MPGVAPTDLCLQVVKVLRNLLPECGWDLWFALTEHRKDDGI